MSIEIFRGKHHSQRVAESLLRAEKLIALNEIDELERDFQSQQASKVYDESMERQFTDIFGRQA